MEQVSATRGELLARRARIGLAGQGRDLLKEQRTALVREFHRLGSSVLDPLDALDRDAADAGRFLGVAVAADGPETVNSAALVAEHDVEIHVRTQSIAGVPIGALAMLAFCALGTVALLQPADLRSAPPCTDRRAPRE
jgi:V/A-type H+-transporting ATPase subunit D